MAKAVSVETDVETLALQNLLAMAGPGIGRAFRAAFCGHNRAAGGDRL